MKKVLSTLLLPIIILSHVIAPIIHALDTNGSANPWTRDKAIHLARSVLFYASPEIIDSLEQAGSAEAAVNILFPNAIGPDRSTYDNLLRDYTSSGFNWGDGNHAIRLYQLIYAADPYEGKRKLFSLFEDIFSVSIDNERGITYKDIHEQHNLIYENMLGSYQTLVKRILYNNGNPGDYAQGSYLDLFNQKDPKNPNENYARELLQLFLMGEYEPFKSKENEDIRNYEESDVRALSRILTGLKADSMSHAITFDISNHYSGSGIVFLSGALNGIAPSYYDNASGTIDPMMIVNPVMSNNGLTDNTIEYIFAKRSQQIALFLADRIYRFYIHDVPTRSELDTIASIIIANNFEILPSVRQVLSHDMMYTDKSMNDIRYKNPLELSIGTIKLMQGNSIGNIILDPNVYDTNLFRRLGWTPYFPGSVFGRDGFDNSSKWTSTSNQNVWMSASNYFTYRNGTGSVNFRALLGKYRTEATTELIPIITNSKNSFTGSLRISSGFLDTNSGSVSMTARATMFSFMSDTGVTDTGSIDNILQTNTGSINPKANTGSADTLTGSTGSGTMKESPDSSTGNTMTMTETGSSLSGTIDTMQQSGATDSGSTQIPKETPTSSGIIKATNESLDMTVTMDIGTGGNVPEVKISSAVSSNGIITLSSGSVTLPLFQLNTDAGILSISGGVYDASTKTLSISSGSLIESGSIIPIYSGTIIMTNDSVISSDIISSDTIIDIYSDYILGNFTLPQDVRTMLQRFLETDESNNPILISPSTNEYYDKKIRGLISMLLSQPEYVLLRGADEPTENNSYEQRFLDNIQGKLIFIELYGGNDYLSSIIPKDEYDVYYNSRASSSGSIAMESSNLVDIGNFYMNSALAYGSGGKPGFKSLYDEGSLKLFNRVGGYKHSQDHDAAAKQISSFDNTTSNFAEGVFGHLIKNEFESSHTISLGARRPNVYRGGKYVNMGGSIILSNPMNNNIKYHMDVLEDMVQLRKYPGNTRSLFSDAGRISDIAKTSVAAGGPGGANGDMNNIFRFMKILMENNIGRSYYMGGFGGYDTHGEQVDTLNRNLNYVSTAVTEFFNSVKSSQDITIVIFSEFGRTNKVNGSLGTDHGDGGGMYVLTSNPSLKSMLSSGTYGNMSIRNAKANSLGIGVDYRSVYGKIYEGIYGVDGKTYFQDQSVSLDADISTVPNNMSLLSYTYQASGKNIVMNGEFTISGSNYNPGKAGYTRVLAGTGSSNLKNTNINMSPTGDGYKYTFRISSNSQPYFQIQSFSNQYASNEVNGVLTGSIVPTILGGSTRSISLTGSSILPVFNNSMAPSLMSGSGIILDATGGTIVSLPYNPNISFRFGTGMTRVTELTSSSGTLTWNGGFLLGEEVDKNTFIPHGATMSGSGESLTKNQVIRLIKIGADKLGVGMKLNQPIEIEFRNIVGSGSYRVLTSEDGILWTDVESPGKEYVPNSGGTILFSTDHFSYFVLKSNTVTPVEIIPSCTINISPAIVNNNTNVQITWNIDNTTTGTLMPNNSIIGKNGSISLIPPPSSSTTYTINIRNSAGSSSCSSSVLTVSPNTGSGTTGTGTNNPTPSNVGPGGGGGSSRPNMKDICTDGDFSGDAYDGSCDLPTESKTSTITTVYNGVNEQDNTKKEIGEFLNNYTANSRNNGENEQILWGISLKLWKSIARSQDNKDIGLQEVYVILREELRNNPDPQIKEATIQIMRNLQTLRNNAGERVKGEATQKAQISKEASTSIKYVSAENSLSIRSSTTISDNIIGYLDRNQKVEVTGTFGEWAKIRYNNTEGFVKNRYLRDINRADRVRTGELPPDTSDQGWISVKHTAFVRRGGQFDAQIVGVVEDDDMVIILDETGNWFEVLWNGMHGYIAKWLVQKERR